MTLLQARKEFTKAINAHEITTHWGKIIRFNTETQMIDINITFKGIKTIKVIDRLSMDEGFEEWLGEQDQGKRIK